MTVRLNFIVEGQTEATFVNDLLGEHFGSLGFDIKARCVETARKKIRAKRKTETIFRGGISTYKKAKKDITLWLKQDQDPNAYFTTMFDLYALPADFPGFDEAKKKLKPNPCECVVHLESAMKDEFRDRRFIPYIQLHEFEALLLSDPSALRSYYPEGHEKDIQQLTEMCNQFESPEHIDDGKESAPSKRIGKHIPDYLGAKATAGPLIAKHIGIEKIREKCKHFGEWIGKLESLASPETL